MLNLDRAIILTGSLQALVWQICLFSLLYILVIKEDDSIFENRYLRLLIVSFGLNSVRKASLASILELEANDGQPPVLVSRTKGILTQVIRYPWSGCDDLEHVLEAVGAVVLNKLFAYLQQVYNGLLSSFHSVLCGGWRDFEDVNAGDHIADHDRITLSIILAPPAIDASPTTQGR